MESRGWVTINGKHVFIGEDGGGSGGYVNAVERRSKVLRRPGAPPFREIVKSGTFRKALETGGTVSLMINHERTLCDTSGGLELREDNVGLYASAAVTDPETVKAAREGRQRALFCDIMGRSEHEYWNSTNKEIADKIACYPEVKGEKEAPTLVRRYGEMRQGSETI